MRHDFSDTSSWMLDEAVSKENYDTRQRAYVEIDESLLFKDAKVIVSHVLYKIVKLKVNRRV